MVLNEGQLCLTDFRELLPLARSLIYDMEHGAPGFEAVIPNVGFSYLLRGLADILDRSSGVDFSASSWSNDVSKEAWDIEHSQQAYFDFFKDGRILSINVSYGLMGRYGEDKFTILCDWNDETIDVDVVCYAETIRNYPDESEGLKACFAELLFVLDALKRDKIVIGLDGFKYPDCRPGECLIVTRVANAMFMVSNSL